MPDFLLHLHLSYAISGLVGGFLVGLTGVGGGSLMTPLLVLLFGIAPSTAVGTDLLYAAITKASGVPVHARKRHIDWRATRLLAYGSLPSAGLTLLAMQQLHPGKAFEDLLKTAVGIALVVTALAILWRASRRGILRFVTDDSEVAPLAGAQAAIAQDPSAAPADAAELAATHHPVLATVVVGAVLGVLVTVSSIGAGAIGTVALVFLYPRFPVTRIVGTDIAHAVPLTFVAGLGHLMLGHVNLALLINLLIGSIPGIWLGSHASAGLSERWSRPILATLLLAVSVKMIAH